MREEWPWRIGGGLTSALWLRGGVNIGIWRGVRVRDVGLTGCGLLCSCAQDDGVEDGNAVPYVTAIVRAKSARLTDKLLSEGYEIPLRCVMNKFSINRQYQLPKCKASSPV